MAGRTDPVAGRVHESAEPVTEPVGQAPPPLASQPAVDEPVEPVTKPVVDVVNKTAEPVVGAVEESSAPVVDRVEGAAGPATEPVHETLGPVVDPVLGTVGDTATPALDGVGEASQPLLSTAGETLGPTIGVVDGTIEPVLGPVRQTVEPVVDGAGGAVEPVLDTATEALGSVTQPVDETLGGITEPVGGTVRPVLGPAVGPVPQSVSPAPLAPEPVSALIGTMPATGTSSAAPALGAFGAPRGGADGLAAVDLPSSSGQHGVAANASFSSAWERAEALAVGTKEAVSNAWSLRGPPSVVAAGLGVLDALIAAARELWATTLGMLFSGGPSAPVPAGPAGVPFSGGSSSGSGASAAGGLGLGVLALLFALSPLGRKFLRGPLDFPRPNSALVLVTERPG